MDLNDLFYRQQVERSWADRAQTDGVRHVHAELARQIERQIEIATEGRLSFRRGEAR